MNLKRMVLLFTGVWVIVFITSCGGTRKNVDEDLFSQSDNTSTQKAAQKDDKSELQDLEALLGITREKPKEKKQEETKKSELSLLGADEGKGNKEDKVKKAAPIKEPVTDARMSRLMKENESLKKQIRQKNNLIQSLQDEVSDLTQQLEKKPATASVQNQTESSNYFSPAPTAASNIMSFEDYKASYQQALDMFNNRDYEGALRQFEQLLQADASNKLSDNAQYWIGECHYMMKKYQQALTDFEKVFTFPGSNKNDYAQFKIAVCYLRLGDRQRARVELERFLENYPKSPVRNKAENLLNRI